MYVDKLFIRNHIFPVSQKISDGIDGVDQNEIEKDCQDRIHKDVPKHILTTIVQLAIICQH